VPDRSARTPVRRVGDTVDPRVAVLVWVATWVVGQILFQFVLVVTGNTDGSPTPVPALALGVVATWCAYASGLWWASEREGSGDVRDDYALQFDPLDVVAVPVGVLTQLVLVPVVYVPLRAIWSDTFTDDRLEETARELVDRATGASLVALVLVVVLGAPVIEELVYRGLLQRSFASRVSDPLALVVVSIWFAVIHFRPIEYPGLFVAGLVFGACLLVTGRLGTAIVAHAAFNATGLLAVWSA
jgi:uncharacterized protein